MFGTALYTATSAVIIITHCSLLTLNLVFNYSLGNFMVQSGSTAANNLLKIEMGYSSGSPHDGDGSIKG